MSHLQPAFVAKAKSSMKNNRNRKITIADRKRNTEMTLLSLKAKLAEDEIGEFERRTRAMHEFRCDPLSNLYYYHYNYRTSYGC